MLPQTQPNRWSCLPTAFAICLGKPVSEIIKMIGHDGSEIMFLGLKEPYNRRSFHLQELIDVCIKLDYYVTEIEKEPVSEEPMSGLIYKVSVDENRFGAYLAKFSGVLIGPGHAVAYSPYIIYNPKGCTEVLEIRKFDRFLIMKSNHK